MKVTVLGLWHLGSVVSACISSSGHNVIGVDHDEKTILDLNSSKAPISEPNLNTLINVQLNNNQLKYSSDLNKVKDSEILWITYDTPVDDDDKADVDFVMNKIKEALDLIDKNTLVLISSQLPVGSIKILEDYTHQNFKEKDITFACSPENLRLGNSIDVFMNPDRVIIGYRKESDRKKLMALFKPITSKIEWMSVESSEMTKHAINAFLATSVTFANEIAVICEIVGADAKEVERGLKSESRIGPKAYLSPGAAFAGGTLARDVQFLGTKSSNNNLILPLINSIKISNDKHKKWIQNQITSNNKNINSLTVCIWGLTYKPGTDTLRRSLSVELSQWLYEQGVTVKVFDPVINTLPKNLINKVELFLDPFDALSSSDILIIGTEWEIFKENITHIQNYKNKNLTIIDPNRFLSGLFDNDDINYISVGSNKNPLNKVRHTIANKKLETLDEHSALKNKVAIITGGAKGLGFQISKKFVASSAKILICGRDLNSLEKACDEIKSLSNNDRHVHYKLCDVSNEKEVKELINEVIDIYGAYDILVNNAGVYGPKGLTEENDWTEWKKAIEINLYGSVLMCRESLPYFRKNNYGKIIQLAGGGATNPMPYLNSYAASKSSIVRFIETLSYELMGTNIDANCIAPGPLNTGMLDEILEAGPEKVGLKNYSKAIKQKETGGVSLDHGANLALFLASSSSDGITGKLISALWDKYYDWPKYLDELTNNDLYTLRRIVASDKGLDWGDK
jgi:UDPglucose 6-dehydrogenase